MEISPDVTPARSHPEMDGALWNIRFGRRPKQIAIGGISHETNTFSPLKTGLDLFRVSRGEEIVRDALGITGASRASSFRPR